MKTDKVKLLDVVALIVDIPEDKLFKGQVGTVVDILADGTAYEVEFSDPAGISPTASAQWTNLRISWTQC